MEGFEIKKEKRILFVRREGKFYPGNYFFNTKQDRQKHKELRKPANGTIVILACVSVIMKENRHETHERQERNEEKELTMPILRWHMHGGM